MTTNVGIDRTNITAGQMKSFWTLAGNPNGSHVNRDSFGAYLERKNPFGDGSRGKSFPTTTLVVSRKGKPDYYHGNLKPLHLKLECVGPPEYDFARISVAPTLSPESFWSIGSIYEHLKNAGMLQYCLGLEDGQAIQSKGLDVFRTLFQGKNLFLFRSASKSQPSKHCYIQAIVQEGDSLVAVWYPFGSLWREHYLAVAYPGYGMCFNVFHDVARVV